MVLIKEFRIVMPFSLDEYRRGSRYSVARLNSEVTTGNEGIELVESKEYVDEKSGITGRYTRKVYHLESRVPGWVKVLAPASALKLDEESWDAFPESCKTVITNRFFGERFSLTIESKHFEMDKGDQENALDLPPEILKQRVVSRVDIGADQPTDKKEYKESEDPRLFKSEKHPERFGEGLNEGWQEKAPTYMCCYKVVTILFKIWGVQGRGENFLMDMESQIFLKFHKEIFCWLDDWFGLSMAEIMAQESQFYEAMGERLEVEGPDDANEGENKKKKKSKKKLNGNEQASSSNTANEASSSNTTSSDNNAATSTSGEADETQSSKKRKKKKKKKHHHHHHQPSNDNGEIETTAEKSQEEEEISAQSSEISVEE